MTTSINKDFKYYLSEFIGGLLLFAFLGFPLWFPLIFIVDDFLAPSSIVGQVIQGQSVGIDELFLEVIHYAVMFIPGILIFVWYKNTNIDEAIEEIDGSFILSKSTAPIADKISWKPKGITGNPKNSAEWKELKPGIHGFRSNYPYQYFTYPVAIMSLLYGLIKITESETSAFEVMFSLTGLLFVLALVANLAFFLMSQSGVWVKEAEKKVQVGVNLLEYSEIRCIQLLDKAQTHTRGGGEPYTVYEANIIFNDNERYNMLNHGELAKFIEQVKLFNGYTNRPVVASDKVLKDIESHNQEAKIG